MYPIAVKIKGKRCLVVGGGRVAERRIEALRAQEADITLVAPDATPGLQALADAGAIRWQREIYHDKRLEGAFLIIAATDQRDVNAAIARDAQARDLLVCCADEYEDGNFTTPAVIRRGDLVLTITTGGKSPTLTALLRERLAAEFGTEWGRLTELLGSLRFDVQQSGDEKVRKRMIGRIIEDTEIQHLLEQGRSLEAEARAKCLLSSSE